MRAGIGVGLASIGLLASFWWWAWSPAAAVPAVRSDASLRVETDPRGAEVEVDGIARGVTPVTIQVMAGSHLLVVRRSGQTHQATLTVSAGADVVHSIVWPAASAPAVPGNEVRLPPPTTPVTGAPARLRLGWLTVASRERLDVYEGLRRVGTSQDARIPLPAGEHVIDLIADRLGFRDRRTVRIVPGGVVSLATEFPRVPVFINAVPWADVWIDGAPVGQTPLGDLQQPIGTHDVEFRHPELGIRHTTVILSLETVSRIAMDMRKP